MKLYLLSALINLVTLFLGFGQTIHAVIIADTNDPIIGKGFMLNKERMITEINEISAKTAMSLNMKIIEGNNLTDTKILSVIKSLNCEKEDMIFFYYAGHAINSGSSKWPKFLIGGEGLNLSLDKINTKLCAKNVRMVLTVGDCCNVGGIKPMKKNVYYTKNDNNTIVAEKYSQLFKKFRGNIITSGSIQGQFSIISNDIGGLFTVSFLEAIYQAVHSLGDSNWEQIFNETREGTQQNAVSLGKEQTPQFEIRKNTVLGSVNLGVQTNVANSNENIEIIIRRNAFLYPIQQGFKTININIGTSEISNIIKRKYPNWNRTFFPNDKIYINKNKDIIIPRLEK